LSELGASLKATWAECHDDLDVEPSLFQRPEPTPDPASETAPAVDPAVAPTRTTRPVVVAIVLLVLVLVAVLLFRQHNHQDHPRVSLPLGGRRTAVLQIDSGADRVSVTTADLGGDLAVVTTPGQSRTRPRATVHGQQVRIWTEDVHPGDQSGDDQTGDQAAAAAAKAPVEIVVRIAKSVRWDVVVDKGARQIGLGLGSGRVHSVVLSGGADHADLTLPTPDGEQVVHVPTGLGGVSFHVPDGVPVQLSFGSGAGRAVVDGQTREGIAAGTTMTGAVGDPSAANRLTLDVAAGVGTLTLDRRAP
jgi:hypothetical protein